MPKRRLFILRPSAQRNGAQRRTVTMGYPDYPRKKTTALKAGLVTIEIYNILGQRERTLVDEYKQPGRYEIRYDSSHLANGMYMYVLKTNSAIEKRKMIIMK